MEDVEERRTGAPPAPGSSEPAASATEAELLARGTAIGRYLIVDVVGTGAMGVVYAAYDRELDRKVALKLVREAHRTSAGHRLLREAQALAQLSHPNVVAVFDVGAHGDQVFFAMEFVAGRTLRTWLADAPRSRSEVIEVFLRAGEGLAAAHAAGIVHRDFKPDNVLIDDHGRVRVADLGLAFIDPCEDVEEEERSARPLSRRGLTATGAAIGTPAYMAPEQRAGCLAVDARADQFSFCVSLHEALCGERPFEVSTLDSARSPLAGELGARITVSAVSPPAAAQHLPARLRRVLARGLEADPANRFPSLEKLLAELRRDPRARRRRVGLAASAAAALVVGAVLIRTSMAERADESPCRGAAGRLHGVWDGERKRAVQTAFRASGSPLAATAWAGVERAIDRWSDDWVAMHTEACEATHVRGEQSDALLDLRMGCLDQRRTELRALVDHFSAKIDAGAVARATEAASSLAPLAQCADATSLGEEVRPPADPVRRSRVATLRRRLADVVARSETSGSKQAPEQARQLAIEASAIGYRPLEAEVLLHQGRMEHRASTLPAAQETLYRALAAAQAGRANRIAVEAWLELGWVAYKQGRMDEAQRLARLGLGALERMGGDGELASRQEGLMGAVLAGKGDLSEARKHIERAVDLSEKATGAESRATAEALKRQASVAAMAGDLEAALRLQRQARSTAEKVWGTDHAAVVSFLVNEGAMLGQLDRLDESLDANRRALAIAEKVPGELGHQRPLLLNNIGLVYQTRKDFARAVPYFERALAANQEIHGPDHPGRADVMFNLAYTLMKMKRLAEAIALYQRTAAIFEHARGADHPDVARTLSGQGEAQLMAGRPRRALPPLERAVALYERTEKRVDEASRARFLLARALWPNRRGRARARRLAEEARAGFAEVGDQERVAEIDRWMARRR
jgi:eukaryotic-like serine/threonine-protein kinase